MSAGPVRPSPAAAPTQSLLGTALGLAFLVVFLVPLAALLLSTSGADLAAGIRDPGFAAAFALSLRSTVVSVAIVVVLGTPLAWWIGTSSSSVAKVAGVVVNLPIVVPPAVVGVGLLQTFGRRGLLGEPLDAIGVTVAFSETAVVLAQVVVAGPFFVQAAANAFRKIEPEMLAVARTLGASPHQAFFRIAVPVALPGLIAGTSLAWARALGEFGATLVFAGNLPGATQTLPLAIFSALESDVHMAVAFSLMLVGLGAVLLLTLRLLPRVIRRLRVRTRQIQQARSPR